MGKGNSKLSPEAITELQKTTQFDKREILTFHRCFLREYPMGYVTREQFIRIYEKFFPFGDSAPFAHHLFRLYDADGDGVIGFGEYLKGQSVVGRGNLEAKLAWAFRLYDVDADGWVGRDDLIKIITAIYGLFGNTVQLAPEEDTPQKRVDYLFSYLERADQGSKIDKLNLDQFRECAQSDPLIIKSLLLYDGVNTN